MRVSRFLSAILSLSLTVVFNSALLAQTITGTISGDVTDSTGAVVANVSITVQNAETGLSRSATTTASGSYRVPDLPIGTYKVSASAQGFKTLVRAVEVANGWVREGDLVLDVGERGGR